MAGNATLTLFNGSETITFEIWMQQFSTSSTNEFATQQVARGVSWMPIRRAEMQIQFSIAWPLVGTNSRTAKKDLGFENFDPADGFGKMNYFQDTIRKHQMAIVNGSTNAPMVLNYYNNSDTSSPIFNTLISKKPLSPLKYSGWIQSVEKNYIRFQNVYMTNYAMNIITPNVAKTPPSMMQVSTTYAPTAADMLAYPQTVWDNTKQLAGGTNYIQGLPK